APGPGRGELIETEVGEDLRQPCLGHPDPVDVGRLPAQEGLLHGVLGLARRAEEAVGDGFQAGPGGHEPVYVVRGRAHGPDPNARPPTRTGPRATRAPAPRRARARVPPAGPPGAAAPPGPRPPARRAARRHPARAPRPAHRRPEVRGPGCTRPGPASATLHQHVAP